MNPIDVTMHPDHNEQQSDGVEALPAAPSAVEYSLAIARERAEIDQQITTARAYPRSLKRFKSDTRSMVTLNEAVADECYYSLPGRRKKGGGKTDPIEGPSIRMAEILATTWGNCRYGARVVDEGAEFVTAQGIFHDLQSNALVTKEVRRRITTSDGRRFGTDMIGVTANAACSIALRNAITAGIPRAMWNDEYEAARRASVGTEQTLVAKRQALLEMFDKKGVAIERVCAAVDAAGLDDIDLSKLATLKGLITAIREGDTTIDEAFPPLDKPNAPKEPGDAKTKGLAGLKERLAGRAHQTMIDGPAPEEPQQ